MFFRRTTQPKAVASNVGRTTHLRNRRQTQGPPFTRDDLVLLLEVYELNRDFTDFVLSRFGDYTRTMEVYDTTDKRVPPLVNPFATSDGGSGHWEVAHNWLPMLREGMQAPEAEPTITVQHYVAGDRGPGTVDFRVRVPLSFIFAETDPQASQ